MDTIDTKIMGRDFRLACTSEEKPLLLRAIEVVSTRMDEIRRSGKAMGVDRVAMLAALQITYETLSEKNKIEKNGVTNLDNLVLERKIEIMVSTLDVALGKVGP